MKELTLDWNEYTGYARSIISEGCVLLENRNEVLPLSDGARVAVFGRIQNHYYKSGLGSGGMVNVSKVIGILDALKECKRVKLNEKLLEIYESFEEEHPFDEGEGWGREPWSQIEMELPYEVAMEAAKESDTAIVIIGRTAGEDKDTSNTPGSYRLTETEERMLANVRAHFQKMVVLLNVASIIDLSFIDKVKPDSVMLVWTGGMVGGLGVVDLLLGDVSPSGHLADTVSYQVEDHFADRNFGDHDRDFYEEDIYVGYRYFETFARDKVRYPFGYGLSYTKFESSAGQPCISKCEDWAISGSGSLNRSDLAVTVSVNTKNSGNLSGKCVQQIYVESPQGKLGKPARVLCGFHKTTELKPGQEECYSFLIPARDFASYDDSGVTGNGGCFVLEPGSYRFYLGENVRDASFIGEVSFGDLSKGDAIIIDQLESALMPVEAFRRIKPDTGKLTGAEGADSIQSGNADILWEETPLCAESEDMDLRRKARLPEEINAQNTKIKVDPVLLPIRVEDLEHFEEESYVNGVVAALTDDELTCLVRGEGMGSSRVTPGTASAFAGISDSLSNRVGLPAVCCSDGPSGMRLDCGMKAFSLPSGAMMACTFNEQLIHNLYVCTGKEMIQNKVDCLLGPGMNIHRHPLNGRNFEYFSEDPLLTGVMARAVTSALMESGVTGVIKHFCGNNQEYRRHFLDSVISERALREIYLKGFEIVIRSGYGDSVMTTYGAVNGLFTAGSYDLNTTILRNQWGFTGIVMTDWWASINERGKAQDKINFGAMVRSQNDMYMVCPDGGSNLGGDNIKEAYEKGLVTKAELQRTAANVIRFALLTEAMKRKLGIGTRINVIGRPTEDMDVSMDDVEFVIMDGDLVFPLDTKESKGGTSYILPFDIKTPGTYELTIVGSSKLGELAQLPVTLFYTGFPLLSFTFHGTEGEPMEIVRNTVLKERFAVMRLYVARNGLELKEIRFRFLHEGGTMCFLEDGLSDN